MGEQTDVNYRVGSFECIGYDCPFMQDTRGPAILKEKCIDARGIVKLETNECPAISYLQNTRSSNAEALLRILFKKSEALDA